MKTRPVSESSSESGFLEYYGNLQKSIAAALVPLEPKDFVQEMEKEPHILWNYPDSGELDKALALINVPRANPDFLWTPSFKELKWDAAKSSKEKGGLVDAKELYRILKESSES